MEKIKIKYFSKDYPRLKKIEQGDWIDLKVDNIIHLARQRESGKYEKTKYDKWFNSLFKKYPVKYEKGDILFLGLGVAMELPNGYEAHIVPRSSTFKKTGFILTNGKGIIDNSYSGDEDEWKAMVYCTRGGAINRFDRLFQFRIVKNQPDIEFEEVETLGNKSRGGYGSTDKNQDKYIYGMRLRGFGPMCQPMNGLIEVADGADHHNILVYDRELTEEEVSKYELTCLGRTNY